ncbi:hypothetical protein ACWGR3_31265, partial [Streptomyces albidoflavus]
YMATRIMPIQDGTDPKLYYSPVKGAHRPVQKIVVAFHAVANLLLLGTIMQERDKDSAYWKRNEDRFLNQVDAMREILLRNTALTVVGRSLVDPLMEQLRLTGLLNPAV